uniref:hypothetical protein n=1 Tax=Salmonella sp. TaxID=599 RepID=UPI001CDA4569|nr:hypothetical protein [Salmonella sp.]
MDKSLQENILQIHLPNLLKKWGRFLYKLAGSHPCKLILTHPQKIELNCKRLLNKVENPVVGIVQCCGYQPYIRVRVDYFRWILPTPLLDVKSAFDNVGNPFVIRDHNEMAAY